MIKIFILIAFTQCLSGFGQEEAIGNYKNNFGDLIYITDSLYFHQIHFKNYSNTYAGKWKISNDTIYLSPSFDINSIRKSNATFRNNKVKDSVLTQKNIQESRFMDKMEWKFKTPRKLFIKNDRLYLIEQNGKIDKRKVKLERGKKKFKTYFIKTE